MVHHNYDGALKNIFHSEQGTGITPFQFRPVCTERYRTTVMVAASTAAWKNREKIEGKGDPAGATGCAYHGVRDLARRVATE